MAAKRTFDIPELMEMILLELPFKDILLPARRVCKTWRDTITHSVMLQRALFLAPLPGGPLQCIGENSKGPPRLAKDESDPSISTVFSNPYYNSVRDRIYDRQTKEGPYRHAEASWRRMLITQPALNMFPKRGTHSEEIDFFLFDGIGEVVASSFESIHYEGEKLENLTFGDIEEEWQKATECCLMTYFPGSADWRDLDITKSAYEILAGAPKINK